MEDTTLTISAKDDLATFGTRSGQFRFEPQTCRPDGDVDQNGSVTASDAVLAFQQALSLTQLSACQLRIADVFPLPATPDGDITTSDALCIFQKALSLLSCLDTLPPSNQPPVVNAGMDQTADAGMAVTLSGTVSDPDGIITSYQWEQTGGTMVSLNGATDLTATFIAPDVSADETLRFRLTATDDDGVQASDEVEVMVMERTERFVSVSAGGFHTCGVLDTGTVQCWGLDDDGQSTPSEGTFTSVSAGGWHTCGVLDTGAVQCWGLDDDGQSTPSEGTFTSVSAGGWHTCGVLDTGAVQCWGLDDDGQSTPPEGTFTSVSAGGWHTCGVLDTGAVQCWGSDDDGQSTPPEGTFTSISAGGAHTCGVLDTGAMQCWGWSADDFVLEGTFTSVNARGWQTCGVFDTGAVRCWSRWAGDFVPEGTFALVSVGGAHTCTILDTGAVECWGSEADCQPTPMAWPVCTAESLELGDHTGIGELNP